MKDLLLWSAKHSSGFRHEGDRAENDVPGILVLRRRLGELQGIAYKIGKLNDRVSLIEMGEEEQVLS